MSIMQHKVAHKTAQGHPRPRSPSSTKGAHKAFTRPSQGTSQGTYIPLTFFWFSGWPHRETPSNTWRALWAHCLWYLSAIDSTCKYRNESNREGKKRGVRMKKILAAQGSAQGRRTRALHKGSAQGFAQGTGAQGNLVRTRFFFQCNTVN